MERWVQRAAQTAGEPNELGVVRCTVTARVRILTPAEVSTGQSDDPADSQMVGCFTTCSKNNCLCWQATEGNGRRSDLDIEQDTEPAR